jgi:hypothetical protein
MVRLAMFAWGFSMLGMSPWSAPWSLVTPYIGGYALCRAPLKTLMDRGITWRGTFYPLGALKRATRNQAQDRPHSNSR